MYFFFTLLLQTIFVTLKITETVDWSWWVIWTPLYVFIAYMVFVLIALAFLVQQFAPKKRKTTW